jgi:hypothetical protein
VTHRAFSVGDCDITIGPSWVVTRFPDGMARAEHLGYGQGRDAVDAMTRDHDYLHSVIAAELGLPWSPTLHAVAHGDPLNRELADYEERVVFARQRLASSQ